ncbi:MAG: glycosyltransferase family 39 protein [Candidatus Velamenicoccus archaeovorus]
MWRGFPDAGSDGPLMTAVQERSADIDPRTVRRDGGIDGFVVTFVAVAVAAVWLLPLGSSLWLDETGTSFVIDGSLHDVIRRALDFQGQFPLYHVLLWSWSKVAGRSEIALRFPSVVAGLVAAWLCYRLAHRIFADTTRARLAACVFLLLPPVAFAAADARPYALALASLLGTTVALVRWMETDRARDAVTYVVLAALTLYLHYLFALAFVSHAVLVVPHLRRMGRRGLLVAAAGIAGLSTLLLPAIPHLVDVIGRRDAMSLFTYGSIGELLAWVAPPMLVLSFVAGYLAEPTPISPTDGPLGPEREGLAPLLVWLVLPPVTLFVAGQVSGIGLFADRHFLSSVPALALLAAAGFALLPPRGRRTAIAVLAVVLVLSHSSRIHMPNDWRGADAAADELVEDPRTPVFVQTSFSESRELDRIRDPRWSQLFLAPLAAYPVRGEKHPLPLTITPEGETYVQNILVTATSTSDRIVLITAELQATWDTWLTDRTSTLGYRRVDIGQYGNIRVILFERAMAG